MKLKNILTTVLASLALVGVTSCEDMFKVDSKVVLFDYENTLDQATDTVYSVLGIIKNMQKIADRSVILGEIRGDLVAASDHANKDLAELYRYNLQNLSKDNRYNNPADYYAVINNCNYFLQNADLDYTRNGKNVFMKEYVAVLSFRAWTYLQMAQVYGQVYYIDKPILSGDDADESKWKKLGIKELADTLLQEFDETYAYYNKPSYGDLTGETGSGDKATAHSSADFFIPVYIIMGDLALWSEQYELAARYYQYYLVDSYVSTGTNRVTWFGDDWVYLDPQGDSYSSQLFGTNGKPICYIPMEIDEFNGHVSELPNIFNSTKDNDYWYQLTRSNALTGLSARQNYCYHWINVQNRKTRPQDPLIDEPKYMDNKYDQLNELRRGDLRLQSVLTVKDRKMDEYALSNVNTVEQTLIKINSEKICLYRKDVIYLRLAEALNRCELPQMAFAVLKSGLCGEVIDSISQSELIRAIPILGVDYSDTLTDYYFKQACTQNRSDNGFDRAVVDLESNQGDYENVSRQFDGVSVKRTNWTYSKGNTMGLHSRGCGDADFDTTYTIGKKLAELGISTATATRLDSIRAVEEFLVDEMALETCFEGYRFGDLMRISMHRGADNGAEYETEFLAKRVASRASATMEDAYGAKDASLYTLLKGDGVSYNPNWFLPLTGK